MNIKTDKIKIVSIFLVVYGTLGLVTQNSVTISYIGEIWKVFNPFAVLYTYLSPMLNLEIYMNNMLAIVFTTVIPVIFVVVGMFLIMKEKKVRVVSKEM